MQELRTPIFERSDAAHSPSGTARKNPSLRDGAKNS
jgi:hypothetical protein